MRHVKKRLTLRSVTIMLPEEWFARVGLCPRGKARIADLRDSSVSRSRNLSSIPRTVGHKYSFALTVPMPVMGAESRI